MSVASIPATRPSYQFPMSASLIRCIEKLDLESLSHEPELSLLRHPDHVGSPDTLNYKFLQCYSTAFQAGFLKSVDVRSAHWTSGVDHRKFITYCDKRDRSGDYVAVNNSRQFADRTGLHYLKFLEYCFQFTMVRGWSWLPRPHQLIPAKNSKLRAKFDEGLNALIQREKGAAMQSQSAGLRSCHGVVGAHNKSAVCLECPNFSACAKLCAEIEALAPLSIAEKQRAQNAARQARFKMRKKVEKMLQ
jgi:hypothetical protein